MIYKLSILSNTEFCCFDKETHSVDLISDYLHKQLNLENGLLGAKNPHSFMGPMYDKTVLQF